LARPALFALALTFLAFNWVYLLQFCSFDLAPDEAHYWDWSRRLDWSYYSKGPLVAWLIRISCEVFGNTPFGVRFPATLCGMLLLFGLGQLTRETTGSDRLALALALFALPLPPFAAVSLLMTIDAPFLACWVWALVALHRAAIQNRLRDWWLAGSLIALGSLAKYTMLLLPLGFGLLALRHPGFRHVWRSRGLWQALALILFGQLPWIIWNIQHEGIGLRHVLGLTGLGEASFRWWGPLEFLGGQAGLLLGFGLLVWGRAAWANRQTPDSHRAFLWGTSVPLWGVFALASFRTSGQVNWPAPAYCSGLILAGIWVESHWQQRWVRVGLVSAFTVGLALGLFARWPQLVRPLLQPLAKPATPLEPCPIRKLDPTARLAGWRTLAAEVDRVRNRVRSETGEDPLLAGMTWTVPGELAMYCEGQPTVYSFGLALADRFSQYDVWRANPVLDAQAFRGRTFVYVGAALPPTAFERMEMVAKVIHREATIPLAEWEIWVGTGFRGFNLAKDRSQPLRY
jgi:hypothetical protein